MKKVLLITYYFPPAGGAGVQRWLKFVKYFRSFGIEPVLYVPDNADYPVRDESLEKDIPENIKIYRGKIFEPHSLLKNGAKDAAAGFIKPKGGGSVVSRFITWVRANFFIPDARMFWIKPSVKRLEKIILEEKTDTVISTGPPHSTHLIAYGLKKIFPKIKWIADFRDPWTKIDYFHHLPLSQWAKHTHSALEQKVLKAADDVIVVSPSMYGDFEAQVGGRLHLITNGFDTDDIPRHKPPLDKKFTVCHIGSINDDRNPRELWQLLGKLASGNRDFKADLEIRLTGIVAGSVFDAIGKAGLSDNLLYTEYMPHKEVIAAQHSAQLLLLLMNRTPQGNMYIAGKLFEYLAADRPILLVGYEKSDAANIVYRTASGEAFDWGDTGGMLSYIVSCYRAYKTGELKLPPDTTIKTYSRKNLTERLVKEVILA